MKIAIDITSTQTEFKNKGQGRYTYEIVKNIISMSRKLNRDDIFYLLTFNSPTTLQPVISENSDKVRTVNIGRLIPASSRLSFPWNFIFKTRVNKLIKDEEISLYFCPNMWDSFPDLKIPTVVMVHDLAPLKLDSFTKALRKNEINNYRLLMKRIDEAHLVLTNSQNTMEDIVKLSNVSSEKIKVIHLGVSEWVKRVRPRKKIIEKYLPDKVFDKGYIFYEGGAIPSKNVPGLLYSYSELKNIFNETDPEGLPYLVIGGKSFVDNQIKNKELDKICEIIEQNSLQENIFFTGYFEDEDLDDLLCASKLFVHLSLYEGFGFSPLQAMKAGVPVIASNTSCYPEVLGDGAILVDPINYKKVAQKIYDLLRDGRKLRAVSRRGLSWVKKYSWEKTAEKTYDVLLDIVNNRKENNHE